MALSPVITRHILPIVLKLLYKSLRISVTPMEGEMRVHGKGTIFAFWHGKMVAGWLLARELFPGEPTAAVVSQSKDGRILSDALQQLGYALIRGSSSRGSVEVIRAMQHTLEKGDIVVITPDGPRGPINQFKYGSIRLAARSRSPLIFARISYAASWKIKSWDRFEIPKPFTRTTVTLQLIELPEFRSEEELHTCCKQLSEQLSHA
ncbi:lysophospholipid acyltransferase family protein [Chlorobium sp. KB01]|uniref:lysophospholipid acyltransferase family protein n=1 Tax=Chlorobium sp. KB01 TaxID=1917528 RepID=UPI000975C43D|nr:lysophospholipid acyltransferase family protein [Chlorobium sp. KB01]